MYSRIICDICGNETKEDNEFVKTIRLCPNRPMDKIDICEQCMRELIEDWIEEEKDMEEMAKIVARIEEVSK
jgi:hypothetical protein